MGLRGEFSGEPADLFELLGGKLPPPDEGPDLARGEKLRPADPLHRPCPEDLAGGQGEGGAVGGPGLGLRGELECDINPQALPPAGLDKDLGELQPAIGGPARPDLPAEVGQGVLGL